MFEEEGWKPLFSFILMLVSTNMARAARDLHKIRSLLLMNIVHFASRQIGLDMV